MDSDQTNERLPNDVPIPQESQPLEWSPPRKWEWKTFLLIGLGVLTVVGTLLVVFRSEGWGNKPSFARDLKYFDRMYSAGRNPDGLVRTAGQLLVCPHCQGEVVNPLIMERLLPDSTIVRFYGCPYCRMILPGEVVATGADSTVFHIRSMVWKKTRSVYVP